MDHTILAVSIIALAHLFNFSNGFHDSSNQVATAIASRALSPEVALSLAAVADFVGAYFLGTSVAKTIGRGIVDPALLQSAHSGLLVLGSALTGAVAWNLLTWYFGIPSSSSHSLLGGLLGAFLSGWGPGPIQWTHVRNIFIAMLLSPLAGFLLTYAFTKLTFFVTQWSTPRMNRIFNGLQTFSLIAQSLAHGAAQSVLR